MKKMIAILLTLACSNGGRQAEHCSFELGRYDFDYEEMAGTCGRMSPEYLVIDENNRLTNGFTLPDVVGCAFVTSCEDGTFIVEQSCADVFDEVAYSLTNVMNIDTDPLHATLTSERSIAVGDDEVSCWSEYDVKVTYKK